MMMSCDLRWTGHTVVSDQANIHQEAWRHKRQRVCRQRRSVTSRRAPAQSMTHLPSSTPCRWLMATTRRCFVITTYGPKSIT